MPDTAAPSVTGARTRLVTMILPPVPVMTNWPEYRTSDIAWQAHVPLGLWVVLAARPRCIVDLTDGPGDSRHLFLQAAGLVAETREVWGFWSKDLASDAASSEPVATGPSPEERVRQLNGHKSHPAKHFADATVDVLHLEIPPDAEALRRLMARWRGALSPDAVVLLHGINHAPDAWAGLVKAQPGRTFQMTDGEGMGLWCCGGSDLHDIHRLCALPAPLASAARRALSLAGARIVELTRFELSLLDMPKGKRAAFRKMSHADARDRVIALHDLVKHATIFDHAQTTDRQAKSRPLGRQGDATLGVMRKSLPQLYLDIEPLVLRAVKVKNDVQDDAIIGIGAKVDAQDEAILGLAQHLRGVLEHPLFRRR
jgi:hypothetical protein